MKKDVIKAVEFFVVSLLTAVLFYPFLHEIGHSFASMIFKARVVEFRLFPLPYVLCDVSEVGNLERSVMGMAGNWFPIIISALIPGKRFGMKVFKVILISISVFEKTALKLLQLL